MEAHIYASMLPALAIPRLQAFGALADADGRHAWLFVEEATGLPFDSGRGEDRSLAATWIATVHATAWDDAVRGVLPARGPDQYLAHLHSARRHIERNAVHPEFGSDDNRLLEDALALLARIERRWPDLVEIDAAMPPGLAHGDFAEQNLRVRSGSGGRELIGFDWEYAGWAGPSVDLAQQAAHSASPDLEVYYRIIKRHRPSLRPSHVRRAARAGAVFRLLASLDWIAEDLAYEGVSGPIGDVRAFACDLVRAVTDLGWPAP